VVTLETSTFSGNTAHYGGAIYATATSIENYVIENSTVSGNNAALDGGGIYVDTNVQMNLYNSTVTNNQADSDFDGTGTGGGVFVGGNLFAYNTILAGNFETVKIFGTYGPTYGECAGTVNLHQVILENYDTAHCFIGANTFTLADPKLDTLKDNGGLTMTHLLLAGSPAIDTGSGGCVGYLGTALTTDQRGVKRPIGTACDLGAYELEPEGDVNGDGVVNVSDVFYLISYLFAGGPVPLGRANVNADTSVSVQDVFYLINYLFASGPAPK
jgi:predicted outer membrane repeat protein